MPFITDDFLLHSQTARRLYHELRGAAADPRLSLPSAAGGRRRATGGSRTCSRSGSRAITTSGARCAPTACPSATAPASSALREVPGLGGDRAALPAQSALSLDPPRAEALLRHRRAARRADARRRSGRRPTSGCSADELTRARHPAEVRRAGASARPTIRPTRSSTMQRSPHRASPTKVYPTFRPDRALQVDDPAVFNPWVERLAAAADVRRSREFTDFARRAARSATRTSTTSAAGCPITACRTATPRRAPTRGGGDLRQARAPARPPSPAEHEQFASYLMLLFGRLDAEKGWTKQLHLGAQRNVNTRMMRDARPRHRLRLDRRLPQVEGARPGTSIGWSRRARCRRRSSTTTIRPTTTRWRR